MTENKKDLAEILNSQRKKRRRKSVEDAEKAQKAQKANIDTTKAIAEQRRNSFFEFLKIKPLPLFLLLLIIISVAGYKFYPRPQLTEEKINLSIAPVKVKIDKELGAISKIKEITKNGNQWIVVLETKAGEIGFNRQRLKKSCTVTINIDSNQSTIKKYSLQKKC